MSSQKAMKAILDVELFKDSDDSDQFDEEVANIYLMALKVDFNDNEVNFSNDELLETF